GFGPASDRTAFARERWLTHTHWDDALNQGARCLRRARPCRGRSPRRPTGDSFMRLITRFCVGLALLASMPLAATAASHAVDVTAVVLPAPTSQRAESPEMGRSSGPSDPIAAAPAATLQAPSNDNCAGAITIPCGNINLSGDTFLATNDYDFSDTTLSCTHYSAPGHDVVYKLNAQVGDQIWVDYQSLADASIYLVKDCSDVTHTCVAGADDGKQNEVEHLSYTFTTAGTYYLILDSY